ncbi:PREDICTED: uncharacterized protein LOC108976876 [Bactrocera latifrons]|uniref:uncharacterized protein LOC108976876 n=1 Tax=Bactrocera latifrons TaxID=174628 RepID=UPI0008DDD87C|nr:PREDICTED: uncharacterized protein LOC108976876 [Bactrocera latifrons]
MDETECPTVPTRPVKTIARKGQKQVGSSTSAEKGTNVSLALAVSASVQSIPPFFLFPRVNMKEMFMTHASHARLVLRTVLHTGANADSPTMLLLDNHGSRLSIAAIDLALDRGITLLSFPPKCTHKMQPLDVAVFASFKGMMTVKHDAWKKSNNPQIFTEVDFVASELSGENLFGDEEKDADNQRRVVASGDAIVTAANEEVSTSEASTSAPASTRGAA